MLYREDYYSQDKQENNDLIHVIIAKHRNGPIGKINLIFDPITASFNNLINWPFWRVHISIFEVEKIIYCQEPGLNWWHVDFQSTALPTELSRHIYNITAYLLFDNTKITSILILVKMEVIFVLFSFALTLIYHLIELALFLHHLRQRQQYHLP